MAELKPCPFCGGKAEYKVSGNICFVKCSRLFCGAIGPKATISDAYVAKDAAIEDWNRRDDNG